MTAPTQRRFVLFLLMCVGAMGFFAGIGWGLPSRRADPYLFGDEPVWSGRKIMQLAGERHDDPNVAANVPQHLLEHRDRIIALNETDAQRAEIIRRYRLYSYQPDENTLLMALGRMKPGQGDFDPKFYQYGGLFVYPVGALLKLASVFHFIRLTPDVAWYIDHPEAFGRFYVVARIWPALWGLVGVWAVFWIARRLSGGLWVPAAAALAYIFMPVVVNMAHEAKPHLPGAVVILLAVIAACRYVETGSRRYMMLTGILCGAALGLVLSALPVFAVIPVMAWLRRERAAKWWSTLIKAGLLAIITYFVCNPYVAVHLVSHREVLRSNLTNSTHMYRVGGWRQGVPNALRLMGEGASAGLAMAGLVGAAAALGVLIRRRREPSPPGGRFALGVLLAVPSLFILLQYMSLAAGKPGEYGRFAILPDMALGIAAIAGAGAFVRSRVAATMIVAALLVATIVPGMGYLRGFVRDSRPYTSRLAAAERAEMLTEGKRVTIGIWAEPAPYAVPPMNLFRNKLLLMPEAYVPSSASPADLLVRAEDSATVAPEWSAAYERFTTQRGRPSQISWADKPFVIYFGKRSVVGARDRP